MSASAKIIEFLLMAGVLTSALMIAFLLLGILWSSNMDSRSHHTEDHRETKESKRIP